MLCQQAVVLSWIAFRDCLGRIQNSVDRLETGMRKVCRGIGSAAPELKTSKRERDLIGDKQLTTS